MQLYIFSSWSMHSVHENVVASWGEDFHRLEIKCYTSLNSKAQENRGSIQSISLRTVFTLDAFIGTYFVQSLFQSFRSLLGEELAEFLESEEKERRLDAVRSRLRLLRDLRMDTRARGVWARLLNDQPVPRRHKTGIKKGGTSRSGCFGHKMDRIGTISGMGC